MQNDLQKDEGIRWRNCQFDFVVKENFKFNIFSLDIFEMLLCLFTKG